MSDRNSVNWTRDFVNSLFGAEMVTVQISASGTIAMIRSSVMVALRENTKVGRPPVRLASRTSNLWGFGSEGHCQVWGSRCRW